MHYWKTRLYLDLMLQFMDDDKRQRDRNDKQRELGATHPPQAIPLTREFVLWNEMNNAIQEFGYLVAYKVGDALVKMNDASSLLRIGDFELLFGYSAGRYMATLRLDRPPSVYNIPTPPDEYVSVIGTEEGKNKVIPGFYMQGLQGDHHHLLAMLRLAGGALGTYGICKLEPRPTKKPIFFG